MAIMIGTGGLILYMVLNVTIFTPIITIASFFITITGCRPIPGLEGKDMDNPTSSLIRLLFPEWLTTFSSTSCCHDDVHSRFSDPDVLHHTG